MAELTAEERKAFEAARIAAYTLSSWGQQEESLFAAGIAYGTKRAAQVCRDRSAVHFQRVNVSGDIARCSAVEAEACALHIEGTP